MGNKRNQEQHDAIKSQILLCTREIIQTEGIDGVSIRKITKAMGYSPGIVYHYFSDKDAIIEHIFMEGYVQIAQAVRSELIINASADAKLKGAFAAYIGAARNHAMEYKAIMTSSDPKIMKWTSMLGKDQELSNSGLAMLKENLDAGMHEGLYKEMTSTIMAQLLWSCLFGFTLKVIVEEIDDERIQELQEQFFQMIFGLIMKTETVLP